jgi:hypothetical protein
MLAVLSSAATVAIIAIWLFMTVLAGVGLYAVYRLMRRPEPDGAPDEHEHDSR